MANKDADITKMACEIFVSSIKPTFVNLENPTEQTVSYQYIQQ